MKTRLALLSSVLALVLGASSGSAATITWTVANATGDGTTNVSTTGTLVDARNGATSDITVNGVTFLSVANSGNLFDSLFNNDNITTRAGTATTGDYNQFLRVGQRSGRLGFNVLPRTEPTEVWTTVNFAGLTVGQKYQIQIWAVDTNTTLGDAGNKGLVLGNGSAGGPVYGTDTVLLYEYADGAAAGVYGAGGQFGTGTFTADATTQSFNVRTWNNLLPSTPAAAPTNSDHFSNGWQLRAIPEPSAALLGGLGLLALLRRRR